MGTEIERVDSPTAGLITLALQQQADPKVIEKLMELQERWETTQARKAYIIAMTAFKQEVPAVLKKGYRVDFATQRGRTSYSYANLGSIVQEITACLGKHELSASWSTEQKGNDVTVTCHITHGAGYRESVTLTGPTDESGNKNRIQAVGSTVTYLQRYTLLAVLGLATGEDDDGNKGRTTDRPPMQAPSEKKPEKPEGPAMASEAQVTAIHSVLTAKAKDCDHALWVNDCLGLMGTEGELEHVTAETVTRDMARKIFDAFDKLGWTKKKEQQ